MWNILRVIVIEQLETPINAAPKIRVAKTDYGHANETQKMHKVTH